MQKTLHDHPLRVDLALVGIVTVHWMVARTRLLHLAHLSPVPDVWKALSTASHPASSGARDLYIAMLGPSAIVAGFAGVVVVFGLTTDSPRFQDFRADAGDALKRTWISSSTSGFVAGLAFVAATLVDLTGHPRSAPYLFEVGLALIIHGAIRLLWILQALIGIKATDDLEAKAKRHQRTQDQMPWNQRRAG